MWDRPRAQFPVTLALSHQWVPLGESFIICLRLCHSVERSGPFSALVDGGS